MSNPVDSSSRDRGHILAGAAPRDAPGPGSTRHRVFVPPVSPLFPGRRRGRFDRRRRRRQARCSPSLAGGGEPAGGVPNFSYPESPVAPWGSLQRGGVPAATRGHSSALEGIARTPLERSSLQPSRVARRRGSIRLRLCSARGVGIPGPRAGRRTAPEPRLLRRPRAGGSLKSAVPGAHKTETGGVAVGLASEARSVRQRSASAFPSGHHRRRQRRAPRRSRPRPPSSPLVPSDPRRLRKLIDRHISIAPLTTWTPRLVQRARPAALVRVSAAASCGRDALEALLTGSPPRRDKKKVTVASSPESDHWGPTVSSPWTHAPRRPAQRRRRKTL